MLVLTRKKNDSIVIDGRITVEVLQVKGGGIRLGITAPPEVSILRGELKPFGVAGAAEPTASFELSSPTEEGAANPSESDHPAAARSGHGYGGGISLRRHGRALPAASERDSRSDSRDERTNESEAQRQESAKDACEHLGSLSMLRRRMLG